MEFKDKLNLLLSREKLNQADLAQKLGFHAKLCKCGLLGGLSRKEQT